MIVVSDTSPLNYLILIHAVDILPKLFHHVYAPAHVMVELQRWRAPAPVRLWAGTPPSWLIVRRPLGTIATSIRLDQSETDAIALAMEMHASTVLIDERKGRRVAFEHGLQPVGTLTVLETAATENLVDLKSALAALQQTSFRVSSDLVNATLARDAARQQRRRRESP